MFSLMCFFNFYFSASSASNTKFCFQLEVFVTERITVAVILSTVAQPLTKTHTLLELKPPTDSHTKLEVSFSSDSFLAIKASANLSTFLNQSTNQSIRSTKLRYFVNCFPLWIWLFSFHCQRVFFNNFFPVTILQKQKKYNVI